MRHCNGQVWDLSTGHQVRSLATDSPVMSLVLAAPNLALYGDKAGKVSCDWWRGAATADAHL